MAQVSFDILQELLEKKTAQQELFDCGDFNLLKILQHALHTSAQNNPVVQRPFFLLPASSLNLLNALKRKRHKKIRVPRLNKIGALSPRDKVLYAGGNIVPDEKGNLVSANTYRLMQAMGKEKCLYIFNEARREITETGQELNGSDVGLTGSLERLSKQEKTLGKNLRKAFVRIKKSDVLSPEELKHLAAHMQNFYDAFRDWYYLLSHVKPKEFYFSPHYHNEGLIAACRMLGVKTIELQHGLVSREDFYYVYPERLRRMTQNALFADEIMVFGEFWKRELLLGAGYELEQIKIIGKYQFHPPVTEEAKRLFREQHRLGSQRIIAIACQTNIPKFYADYVTDLAKRLEKDHPGYMIVLKPHPRQIGMDLLEACTRQTNVRLMGKTESLMTLLHISDIQISIYSTTFFDALGLPVVNLSLQDNELCGAYARSMAELGVAVPIQWHDDPVTIAARENNVRNLNPEDVFAAFSPSLLA